MSKKVVIAGSASLPEKIDYWKRIWEDQGYLVTAYPRQLPVETFFDAMRLTFTFDAVQREQLRLTQATERCPIV
ncbi:MAG: hypothetical protein UY00_C0053G0005 [Candidatus Wolfebacteria bacterium GW2011_GWA1_47_6]|nr:MAG: hypothetical protein UY00_C0053G0005 [Candidatus Wolfebacteria bacterium GW2011_GWA1_47_6]